VSERFGGRGLEACQRGRVGVVDRVQLRVAFVGGRQRVFVFLPHVVVVGRVEVVFLAQPELRFLIGRDRVFGARFGLFAFGAGGVLEGAAIEVFLRDRADAHASDRLSRSQ